MRIVIPGYANYSVEGQNFEPDGDGVFDIPDALVKKIPAAEWRPAPTPDGSAPSSAEAKPPAGSKFAPLPDEHNKAADPHKKG